MSEPTRPIVFGIETSCDDTACAVLDGSGRVLSSVVGSQLAAHRPYGGVVPEIASREHLTNWTPVSEEALRRAGVALSDVDVVAATRGPGLVGSLLVGLSLGKAIAWAADKPFHAVHHLEGHLFSPFLGDDQAAAEVPARFVGLVVSGGHTLIYEVEDGRATAAATTRDDAMGEVFDKVGKKLGLAYPQGPRVDQIAELGDAESHPFPLPRMSDGSLDFSYSGLKSRALAAIEKLRREGVSLELGGLHDERIPGAAADLLAGFRAAAVAQILDRLTRLHGERPFRSLAVSGGAAANRLLRAELPRWAVDHGVDLHLVRLEYSGDNAAMIAHAALLRQRLGLQDDPRTAEAASRIP